MGGHTLDQHYTGLRNRSVGVGGTHTLDQHHTGLRNRSMGGHTLDQHYTGLRRTHTGSTSLWVMALWEHTWINTTLV